jgi:secernin
MRPSGDYWGWTFCDSGWSVARPPAKPWTSSPIWWRNTASGVRACRAQGMCRAAVTTPISLPIPLHLSHARAMRSRELLGQKKEGEVCPRWMMRTLRDHYDTTFLQGPYFNAALPDFLSICMHVSPAAFTWGNTASSAVFILPASKGRLPVFWWTACPPCTGLYLPFFVDGSKLPEILSTAGKAGKSVTAPPPEAVQDQFSPDSWWWQFRELHDMVRGDEIATMYNERQPMVRATFDAVEKKFAPKHGRWSRRRWP